MRAQRKARFCLVMGIPPSEYEALTRTERDAFNEQHNVIAAKMKERR